MPKATIAVLKANDINPCAQAMRLILRELISTSDT